MTQSAATKRKKDAAKKKEAEEAARERAKQAEELEGFVVTVHA